MGKGTNIHMIMVVMQDNPVCQKNFREKNTINLQILDLIKRSKNGLHFLNQNASWTKNNRYAFLSLAFLLVKST